ncbi:MAG: peptidase [Desulfurococcales archaeon ex4484_58]|nr:MAG: peptidase [Desulfurococcales archaeon ex4484_58]
MDVKLFDLHEDISTYIVRSRELIDFSKDVERHADIPKYKRSNTKAIVAAIFPASYTRTDDLLKYRVTFKNSYYEVFHHLLIYYKLVKKYRVFKIIEKKRELMNIFNQKKKIGLIIGLEGSYPIREPDELEILYKLGIRVLGLTWNVDNQYAASCMTEKDYGLTSLGVKLVEKAIDLGMVIDLAHSSHNTMRDVLSIVEKPVMISHTGLKRFNDSPRNIDDEILELIKRNGGVVGVFFVAHYLEGENTSIDTIVKHIMYIRENYGLDIIAIGSDYFGTEKLPQGLENIGKIDKLANKLSEKGLSRSDIEKILYQNALRIFIENMKN